MTIETTERTAPSDMAPPLLRADRAGVTTLTLNRPAQFNALSDALLAALQSALDQIAQDPSVRCVVLAAVGKAFCAGHDLREMQAQNDTRAHRDLFHRCSQVMQAIRALQVPVIAEVQGVATAAGCQLVATCDLAIAARSARFAVSGINVGLFCSTPAVALSRSIPAKAAFDMLVTGRFIDAELAVTQGLINAAVDDDTLAEAVAETVAAICAKSPAAIRMGKQMFYAQGEMPLGEAYSYAGDVMARNMMHEDAQRGVAAFLRKGKP